MAQQEIGWGIEAKLLAQIKSLIARNGGSSVAFLQYPDATAFPPTGQSGAIYLALDTNKIYYWDGSGYVEMAGSGSSVVSYPSLASFPMPGSTGVIYIALDTNRLYRWDSGTTSYIEVSPATDAIVVLGGGAYSSLRCGSGNATTGNYSTAFGRSNTASGPYTSIFGQCNTASGVGSTVMAGFKNQAQGSFSTIGGGICNNACNVTSACLATGAAVLGGIGNNTINGTWDLASCSFLTPPTICDAGAYSTIGGGFQNKATGGYTTVFGGYNNTASGLVSAVGGGTTNQASGACSFIGGGKTNTSSGAYSAILAGKFNDTNNFADAMIIGSNLTASQACTTFVNNISVDTLVPGSAVCVTTNKVLTTYSAITGSGTAGQVTYWSGTSAVTGSSNLVWNATYNTLGIGTAADANHRLSIAGSFAMTSGFIQITRNLLPHIAMNATGANWGLIQNQSSTSWSLAYGTTTNALGTAVLTWFGATGNVAINTTTDGGQRLQVIGDAFIKGSGNTSATTALTVQNSDAAATFSVLNNGMIRLGSSTSNPLIFPQTNLGSSPTLSGTNLSLYSYTTSQSASLGRFWFGGDIQTQTSGDNVHLYLSDRFSPTSGTATKSTLSIIPIINQTGGANGITRALYINPTLTAAADFRAIETTAGNVLFGSNFFWDNTNARLGIGISSPLTNLDVSGGGRIAGIIITGNPAIPAGTGAALTEGYYAAGNYAFFQGYNYSLASYIPVYIDGSFTTINPNSGGNVAIGSSTNSGQRLQVIGSMRVGTTAASAMYWDDTNNRLGIGTSSPTAPLHINSSVTASSAIARGINFTPTLVAAANNDVLVGLDINPTFTNGAFTGVNNIGIRATGTNSVFINTLGDSSCNIFSKNNNEAVLTLGSGAANSTASSSGKTYINFWKYASVGTSLGIDATGNLRYINGLGLSGTTFLSIYSTGNISINSSTDGGERLQVIGSMRVGTTAASAMYWDDTNNRLGIGTSSPISSLETYSNSIYIAGAFSMYSNTATDEPIFYFRRGRGTLASPTVISAGDTIGSLRFAAQYTATIGSYNTNAKIESVAEASGANLGFYTNTGGFSASPTLKLRIYGNGNTIIQNGGTFTDAGYRLDVQGTMRATGQVRLSGLPTSATGLSAGDLWNNSGVINIV